MKECIIRTPEAEDAGQIRELGFVLEMLFLYHGDFDRKNMFCAVNGEGEILAVAHLMPHDSFFAAGHEGDKSFISYLTFEINFAEHAGDEQIRDALIEALLGRTREIRAEYPDKRIVLAQYIDADDLRVLGDYLAQGFTLHDTIVVYKFDLTQEIPVYTLPEGVVIRPYKLDNNVAQEQYHQAELASFDGMAWSMNHLGWMQGAQEMMNFGAFAGERLLGNTSTWRISDGHNATENVFVIPEWRSKGVARGIICTALAYLKQEGKTVATLGTHGGNQKAIRLYTQLGYKLEGFRFMVGYEAG